MKATNQKKSQNDLLKEVNRLIDERDEAIYMRDVLATELFKMKKQANQEPVVVVPPRDK